MALPYSDDLRCKLLEAYEAGAGSLRELASQFRVSWGYSKKVRAHQVRTGGKEGVAQQRHGPPSRMTDAVQVDLRAWLSTQPDRFMPSSEILPPTSNDDKISSSRSVRSRRKS